MTNTGRLEVTTPTDREVVMTRLFDAPRQLVFDALTRPELLKRWLAAPGRTLEVCEIDLKAGGAYRFVWRGAGKTDVGMHGEYREVVHSERLVTTEAWEDWDVGEILATTVLAEEGRRTRFTSTVIYPTRQVRDAILESGMERGATESYEKLAELLATTSAQGVSPDGP